MCYSDKYHAHISIHVYIHERYTGTYFQTPVLQEVGDGNAIGIVYKYMCS